MRAQAQANNPQDQPTQRRGQPLLPENHQDEEYRDEPPVNREPRHPSPPSRMKAPRSPARHQRRPPYREARCRHSGRTARHSTRYYDSPDSADEDIPTPRHLTSLYRETDILDEALDRQYPQMGHPSGTNINLPTPKTCLPPDMRKRIEKEKRDLTFPEYICGYSRMLVMEVSPDTVLYQKILHMSQLAEDTATLGFAGPRLWSQTCMDHVMEGDVTWRDTNFIASERMRLSWLHPCDRETGQCLPCPNFNSGACQHNASHEEGSVCLVHCCGVCMHASSKPGVWA